MRISDWSSDVCSSDLLVEVEVADPGAAQLDRQAAVGHREIAAEGGDAGRVAANELAAVVLDVADQRATSLNRDRAATADEDVGNAVALRSAGPHRAAVGDGDAACAAAVEEDLSSVEAVASDDDERITGIEQCAGDRSALQNELARAAQFKADEGVDRRGILAQRTFRHGAPARQTV